MTGLVRRICNAVKLVLGQVLSPVFAVRQLDLIRKRAQVIA